MTDQTPPTVPNPPAVRNRRRADSPMRSLGFHTQPDIDPRQQVLSLANVQALDRRGADAAALSAVEQAQLSFGFKTARGSCEFCDAQRAHTQLLDSFAHWGVDVCVHVAMSLPQHAARFISDWPADEKTPPHVLPVLEDFGLDGFEGHLMPPLSQLRILAASRGAIHERYSNKLINAHHNPSACQRCAHTLYLELAPDTIARHRIVLVLVPGPLGRQFIPEDIGELVGHRAGAIFNLVPDAHAGLGLLIKRPEARCPTLQVRDPEHAGGVAPGSHPAIAR